MYKLLDLRVADLVKLGGMGENEDDLRNRMDKEDEENPVVHNIRAVLSKDKVEDMFQDLCADDGVGRSPEDMATENARFKFRMRMIEQKLKKIGLFL